MSVIGSAPLFLCIKVTDKTEMFGGSKLANILLFAKYERLPICLKSKVVHSLQILCYLPTLNHFPPCPSILSKLNSVRLWKSRILKVMPHKTYHLQAPRDDNICFAEMIIEFFPFLWCTPIDGNRQEDFKISG